MAKSSKKETRHESKDDALQLAAALNQEESDSESDPMEFSSEEDSDSDM